MKKFADLHLRPDLNNKHQTEKVLSKASELGFKIVGISLPPNVRQNMVDFLQQISTNCGVDFCTRIDLVPKSSGELLKSLRKFRRKFVLVAVQCSSKSIARQAAKDHRVDLLVFPSIDPHERFFDNAEARLASESFAALEIDIAPLLRCAGFSRARLLSSLRKEVATAARIGVPVVICSGAVDWYQLRGPYESASLAMLFGMQSPAALSAVSFAPSIIVERNRKKLDSTYVARGIRIIRRRGNCD